MEAKRLPWFTNSFVAVLTCATLFLAACGGGGGGGGGYSGTTPPSGLSYTSPQAFTVGQAITALNPTVTGTVSSYSVSPALPAGLSISTTSGVISGTPSAVTAQASYTVTATNSGGSATAAIMIAINDVKPQQVAYSAATVAMATNVAITPLVPSASGGGAVTSWSISPALPTGLSFSTTNGAISGTPTAASAVTAYTVTATNSGGSATFALTLTVQSATLLDLGHTNPISVLRFDGTKALSADISGHWVLWNYAAGTQIASGDSGCTAESTPTACNSTQLADFAGSIVALLTPTGFEVRSATDGHVVTTITSSLGSATAPVFWQLATDGSYLVANNTATLQVWSTANGATLVSKKGSYLPKGVYAAPGQVQAVLLVPGPQNLIETTSVSTGTSTDSPAFNGTFQSWFADGNRFASISTVGNAVLTYSAAAVQQDLTTAAATQVVGTGNWLGIVDGVTLNVYKVGASSSPAATYVLLDSNGHFSASGSMFIANSDGGATFIDLSGAAPVRTDAVAPVSQIGALAGISPTQWLGGNNFGVIFDGASSVTTPRYLADGQVWSIAGTGTRFAIASASGRIHYYDSTTNTLEGTIQDFSSKLVLSADGTVLAAFGDTNRGGASADPAPKVYSLPGGGTISTWPYTAGSGPYEDISLSPSGTVLGLVTLVVPVVTPVGILTASTYPVTGGAATWTENCGALYMSSNASNIACAGIGGRPQGDLGFQSENSTHLYNNGTLVAAFTGVAVGWLDDGHLLVNYYTQPTNSLQVTFQGVTIYGPTGTVLSTPPLPEMFQPQPVTATSVYNPTGNAILSVTDGHVIWLSPDPVNGATLSAGAVAGNNVVFASGTHVIALTH